MLIRTQIRLMLLIQTETLLEREKRSIEMTIHKIIQLKLNANKEWRNGQQSPSEPALLLAGENSISTK